MRMLFRALGPVVLVLVTGCSYSTPPAEAQAADQAPQATPEPLENTLRALVVAQQNPLEAFTPVSPVGMTPVSPVTVPSPDELPAVANPAVEAVLDEVTALRKEMSSLRHELSGQITELAEQLRQENEKLRQEVTRLSASASSEAARARIPAPEGRKQAEPAAAPEEAMPAPEAPEAPEPKGPARPFIFTSVKEWGRSPEEAARMTPKASSLAGVVGTVPRGSREKDLITLGLQLREKYKGYENINIEVFDDADAARLYAERNTADTSRRVLSVSKHEASGRDAVLVYRKGIPIDVTSGAPEAAERKKE